MVVKKWWSKSDGQKVVKKWWSTRGRSPLSDREQSGAVKSGEGAKERSNRRGSTKQRLRSGQKALVKRSGQNGGRSAGSPGHVVGVKLLEAHDLPPRGHGM